MSKQFFVSVAMTACAAFGLVIPLQAQTSSATGVTFQRAVLDTVFRSEGVAVGDFNKDGKSDIAAGAVWYAAPDWKMQLTGEKAPEYDPLQYSHAFQTFADDLNGDGWTDLIIVDWPGSTTWWLENPKKASAPWPQHVLTPVTNNESPQFVDVDGDGKLDLVVVNHVSGVVAGGTDTVSIFRNTSVPGTLSSNSFAAKIDYPTGLTPQHVAVGDLDGDGRPELAVANFNSGTISLMQNRSIPGQIDFAPKVDLTAAVGIHTVEIGDLDGDQLRRLADAHAGADRAVQAPLHYARSQPRPQADHHARGQRCEAGQHHGGERLVERGVSESSLKYLKIYLN
jgi:hypothetical protein